MRILHVINNLANGGAERLLSEFLPHLKDRGHSVTLLLLTEEGSVENYIEKLKAVGINICVLKKRGGLYHVSLPLRLNAFLNESSYDVIHAHLFPAFYYVALVKRIFKRTERFYFTEHSINNRRIGNKLFRIIEKFIYKSFDGIIVISDLIKSKLDDWLGISKITHVVRNGIDLRSFEDAIPIDLFSLNPSENDTKFILMAARFEFPKRQDLLISAMNALPHNYVLLLAGMGPTFKQCQDLVLELNLVARVQFLGHRSDVPNLMKSVDLNLLFTEYEGMSGVTIEALLSGKPFLGSNVPGVNDVVPSSYQLFDNSDMNGLIQRVVEICSTDQSVFVKQQADHAMQFTIGRMVEGYLSAYGNKTSYDK